MGIQAKLIQKVAISSKGDFKPDDFWTVFTDSRKQVEHGFFIPIVGERFDGHDFIEEAVKNGAKGAFWEQNHPIPSSVPSTFPLFFVKDTLTALQESAERYLEEVGPTVVGITGSNGKTTTKDMVEALCKQVFNTHKTEGNFNNHIGLPMTILGMPSSTEVLILEMGMNHFGEIERLSQLAKPHFAIITNIGESHIEFLGSREGIAKAKLEILSGLKEEGLLIIDGDEPLLTEPKLNVQTIKVGFGSNADQVISSVQMTDQGSVFLFNGHSYNVPLFGKHNVKNLSMALALAHQLKIDEVTCKKALKELKITGMRFEVLQGPLGTRMINDAYNSSPTSMIASIETLKMFTGYERLVAVLGDMYELGPDEESLHRKVASHLSPPVTDLVTVGPRAKWIAEELDQNDTSVTIQVARDQKEALALLFPYLDEKTVLLFKASRGMKLETLIQSLIEKGGTLK